MKFNSSKIIIIIIIIISIVTVNINYIFSIINSRNLILINILNHKENYFEGINNSLNRFEIANLFEEEYEDIRKLIIFGNWGNDLISKNNMFSSISEDEIIYILDKYASLKNLEIRELNTHYKNIDSKSFDALNRLMTSNILNEDFLIEPLNIDLIKDAINKTKK